jgi:23S rRNA (guanosine2251-2'-O)-methyltransferase
MSPKKTPRKKTIPECILLLHDIRSVINVGALFRTADSVGVSRILLSGTSPAPIDRFGRKRSDFVKAALGAEDSVIWNVVEKIIPTIKNLKKQGYRIIVLEQANNSIDYKKVSLLKNEKIVLIPGNEVDGVPKKILDLTDTIIEIPMRGTKESLNVSVATGIALYRLLDT